MDRAADDHVGLVLQGGGALGAYQAGVFEALAAEHIAPNWVAGTSIGAISGSLIAGNAPGERVARLREFWALVTSGAPEPGWNIAGLARHWLNHERRSDHCVNRRSREYGRNVCPHSLAIHLMQEANRERRHE